MKTISTCILLLFCTIIHAQQLSTVEYYFDTDPGFGNGTQVVVNGSSLDSTIHFTAPDLSSGVHTIFVRMKNVSGNWSPVYQSNILFTNGIAGDANISTAEYFFDVDPGFGKGRQLSLNNTTIDSTLAFDVNGLSSGVHVLYVRLKNNSNAWSTVYQGSFLLTNGSASSTAVTGAEYFFDTDPGVGNGTQVVLNNSPLDSTLNFSTNGLTSGKHTLFIRLKNNGNQWGITYTNNFNVFNGAAGSAGINSLEYFLDKDAGVSQNTLLPLNGTGVIDTTISIPIADNGADYTVLGLRMYNQTGQAGNAELDSISLCNLFKPSGGFRSAQYGNIVSLIDTSRFNTSNSVRWLSNNVEFNNGAAVNYQFTGVSASNSISELTGTGCRTDTVTKIFSLGSVESYMPHAGSYSSDFNLNIYGGGLDTNAVVYLQKGDTIIYPYTKFSNSPQQLLAEFDFHIYQKIIEYAPKQLEEYTLHVIYSNGQTYTGKTPISMLKIETLNGCNGAGPELITCPPKAKNGDGEPYIAATFTGNTGMRSGVWNPMTLTLTNTGLVVAKQVMFHIIVPSYIDIDTTQWNIIMPNPDWARLSVILPIDTVVSGKHLLLKDISLIEPVLGPGETKAVPFRIRTTNTTPFSIFYEIDKRMFGSPWAAVFPPCITAWLDGIGGFIPFYSCFLGAYDVGTNIGQGGVQVQNAVYGSKTDLTPLMSAPSNYLGAIFSCVPGGGAASQAAGVAEKGFVNNVVLDGGNMLGGQLLAVNTGLSVANNGNPCTQKEDEKWLGQPILTRLGWDPNYLSGNSIYDSVKHFINNYSPQYYSASFENKPAATANAQHVYITDTLNPQKFVFSTFNLTQFTIADSTYSIPAFRQSMTKDVSLKYRQDMKLRFAANFDTATGILRADFFSIDNAGHVLPPESLDGFLPPDTDGISGTGSIGFTVYARALNTLDTFANKAVIYFDANEPIATNTWMNTVDTTSPQSAIINTIRVNDTTVKLIIQRSDIGAGNYYTTLYGKQPADSAFHSMGTSTSDTIVLTGQLGQTWQLFVKATDNVGNEQLKDSAADISYTFITEALPVHLLSFSANKDGSKVKLLWTTTNEINFARYDVERSADGISFTKLASADAKGGPLNNNYLLYDEHPFAKSNYYRLKQIDKDGSFTYSRIIKIDFDKAFTLAITPVPAHDYIIIDGAENFKQVQLVDMSGRMVKQFSKITGNLFSIQDVPAGMYLVRLVSDSTVETLKMVKQ